MSNTFDQMDIETGLVGGGGDPSSSVTEQQDRSFLFTQNPNSSSRNRTTVDNINTNTTTSSNNIPSADNNNHRGDNNSNSYSNHSSNNATLDRSATSLPIAKTNVATGLTTAEVAVAHEQFGTNEIPVKVTPLYVLFLRQFAGFLPFLIEIAAIISLAVQDYIDFGIIVGKKFHL